MSKYRDQLEKIAYYRERIMQSFLKRGIFPGHAQVEKKLDELNESLSIFRAKTVRDGKYFDAEEFNRGMADILIDLRVLYKTAYKMAWEDYEETRSYVESHLKELEALATRCHYKTQLETTEGYLGETIYFRTSGFTLIREGTEAIVDLGSITVPEGSKLACLIDAENIIPNNVLFSFDGMNCAPYALAHDMLSVPGKRKMYIYAVDNDPEIAVNGPIPLNIGVDPEISYRYLIYAGLNMVCCSSGSYYQNSVLASPGASSSLTFSEAGRIEFYVVDGTFIQFNFNQAPTRQNFSGTAIENGMSRRQKISIEFDAGFTVSFVTNGDIYALKKEGRIIDGGLYYPDADQVHQFLVEELAPGEDHVFSAVRAYIGGLTTEEPVTIGMIAIKRAPDDNDEADSEDIEVLEDRT